MKQDRVVKLFQKLRWFDYLVVALMVLGLVMVIIGSEKRLGRNDVEVEYITAESQMSDDVVIWVDVAGAVVNPGVYELKSGARIKDALVLAGGLSETADRDWVSRVLNLAEKINDGEKIFIPTKQKQNDKGQLVVDGLININTVGVDELDDLWGIGKVRAQAIVENRPYTTIESLVEKKVIPKDIFEKNKDRLSVY